MPKFGHFLSYMEVFKIKGKVKTEVEKLTNKQKDSPYYYSMVEFNCDISNYYSWFLKKRFNLELIKPLRGTHVSFIYEKLSKKKIEQLSLFEDKLINVYYDTLIRSNGSHWWLRAYSPEIESIRMALGLTPQPHFAFHITIGKVNEKNLEHSQYIFETIKKFNLLPNVQRVKNEDLETFFEKTKKRFGSYS